MTPCTEFGTRSFPVVCVSRCTQAAPTIRTLKTLKQASARRLKMNSSIGAVIRSACKNLQPAAKCGATSFCPASPVAWDTRCSSMRSFVHNGGNLLRAVDSMSHTSVNAAVHMLMRSLISSRTRRKTTRRSSSDPFAAAGSSKLQCSIAVPVGNVGHDSFALSQTVTT